MTGEARVLEVPISEITVLRDERQRREFKTEDLEQSISSRIARGVPGLIQPIVIDESKVLRAGERRLTACRNLGLPTILARFISDLSPVEAQILELEENVKRQDLEWKDAALAVARIDGLYRELDPDWTMADTSDAIGLGRSMVSMYIRVNGEMENPRVEGAGSVREAYNVIARADSRAMGDAIESLLEVAIPTSLPGDTLEFPSPGQTDFKLLDNPALPRAAQAKPVPPPESILLQSFLDWAPSYSGPKFSLVHCDFPYGVELFSGPQGRGAEPSAGYTDSASTYQTLLECFCTNLDKFMSQSAHLLFWLSADAAIVWQTRETFRKLAPSLEFYKFPLIWFKSDNAGIASDPRHGPRHVYEVCLLASRGKRQICKVVADAYSAPTDKKLHASTKPEPMLKHFMTMLVDQQTSLLDPTCGSAASLRAAEALGASRVLGLEINPDYCETARTALRNARTLRAGSKLLG